MNEKELSTPEVTPQPQPREWVTPAFEQAALKDALGGPSENLNESDLTTWSS